MLETYFILSFILCTYLLVFLKDVDIFDDGKEKENNLIKVIAIGFVSTFWIITLPILIIEQRKEM